jgi:3-hydroxyisobutyryl-CoA hydrolase
MRASAKLIASRVGTLGVVVLNNPRPLHALTLDMAQALHDILTQWYAGDSSVGAVLMKSSQESKIPAFCSGGDVKTAWESGTTSLQPHGQGQRGVFTADFFREEYIVNHILATAPIPQISFWDGMVMGGGVGLSIHGMYRVATERTIWAMPETAIGLFPDVGSMYWMPRFLKPGVAVYLALTGQRLRANDLIHTGLATHFVPSNQLVHLEAALSEAPDAQAIGNVLDGFHQVAEPSTADLLQSNEFIIDKIFDDESHGVLSPESTRTVEDMIQSARDVTSAVGSSSSQAEFAKETLETLQKRSPTSLKVTLEGLRRGKACATLGQDLVMEYRMSQAFMRRSIPEINRPSDFYEGIRAVLIDKDHQPQWFPPTLAEVTTEMVHSYFAPLPDPNNEWQIPATGSPAKL